MFGYVVASVDELNGAQKKRYNSIYCGICRSIGGQSSQAARVVLRYDCAFLALLLMSLYEPRDESGKARCLAHPVRKRPWVDNEYIRYAADINVALACYKAEDDWHDEKKLYGKALTAALKRERAAIEARYPRQCGAMASCIRELSQLEKANCGQIDLCAGRFGALMAELMVYREDHWSDTLRKLGDALGRFVYIADAVDDFSRDEKKGRYNPLLAMNCRDSRLWREYLTVTMGRCAAHYEHLPLVQDKDILDNIIYSGVWTRIPLPQEESHA